MKKFLQKIDLFFAGKKSIWPLIIFFGGIPLFLALNSHSRCGIQNYHSEIFSDKAGYYVYLPSTFIYGFDANSFPDSIDYKTGLGFLLIHQNGKVLTKYPYGVALLQTPFFLTAHFLAPFSGYEQNGFSLPYHKAIDIAAVFYFFWGIYFLQKFLSFYFKNKLLVGASLLLLSYGTNLMYYVIQETGMSHIYSFFLFSVLLYYWKRISESETIKFKHVIIISFAIGFVVITRQLNVVYLPFVFLIGVNNVNEIKNKFLLVYKYIPILVTIGALCVLPQILYYFYLSGKPFLNLYINEHFIYKFSPKMTSVWFAFENGFFIYNPIHLFTIGGVIWMIYKRIESGRLIMILFLLITYINGAWWSWQLGCGFGHRGFVEFYPFLSLGFLNMLHFIFYNPQKKIIRPILLSILIFFTYYSFQMGRHYDGCWYGKNSWDVKEYCRLVSKALI